MATQNADAVTPSIDSNVRHTAHLPREPAQVEREAPSALMFGTSVVNCMKFTAASGSEAALYFCLSVRLDSLHCSIRAALHYESRRICQFGKKDSENATNLFQNSTDDSGLSYALRYRVVNLSWEVPNVPLGIFPFIAECMSAPFAIYSSKE